MCKARNYSEQLLKIYNNINNDFISLNNELRQADLLEQDLLHTIEAGNFNAFQGYKLSKMIHDNRVKRRDIKNELDPLFRLKNNFVDVNVNRLNTVSQQVIKRDERLTNLTENQIYTPRVLDQPTHNNTIKTYHRRTKKELKVLYKLEDGKYWCKLNNKGKGAKGIVNQKDIVGFDQLEWA